MTQSKNDGNNTHPTQPSGKPSQSGATPSAQAPRAVPAQEASTQKAAPVAANQAPAKSETEKK